LKIIPEKAPAVFVFVAIDAEILPVGAVQRIIQGIPVLVVHRQQLAVPVGEFPPALGADHPVDLQGALPVVTVWRGHRVISSNLRVGRCGA